MIKYVAPVFLIIILVSSILNALKIFTILNELLPHPGHLHRFGAAVCQQVTANRKGSKKETQEHKKLHVTKVHHMELFVFHFLGVSQSFLDNSLFLTAIWKGVFYV